MGSHPINLGVRFLLELSALLAIGIWGWRQSDGLYSFIIGFGIPIVLAAIWGVFAVPNDPSRSGDAPIAVAGIVRLFIELMIFAFACWALYEMRFAKLFWIMTVVTTIHYIISYDRIIWLLSK